MMIERPKVYLLTRRNPEGATGDFASGAVISSETLGIELGRRGVYVSLLTLQGKDVLREGNEQFKEGFRRINYGAQSDADIIAILERHRNDYDLIHIRGSTFPNLKLRLTAEALRSIGKPIVYTLVVEGALENLIIPHDLFTAVVGLSRKVCDELKVYGFSPVYHIPNAINTFEFSREAVPPDTRETLRAKLNIKADSPVFFTHCRIDEEKNLALLREVWSVVFTKNPCARLILAGEPAPGRTKMKELYDDLNMTDGILCVGRVDLAGVRELAAASDFCISTSLREGLSRSIMEGMAMELVPVADAQTAGNADVIDHGMNGFLYDRKNLSSFVDTLEMLIELHRLGDGRLREIAARARETIVSNHNIGSAAESYMRLYRYILGANDKAIDDLMYT